MSLTDILIVVLLILAVAAVAIPRITHSQIAADESAALAGIRDIYAADQIYAAMHPDVGFAPDLASLTAPLKDGKPLDIDLASGRKNGYTFVYTPGEKVNGSVRSFSLAAVPDVVGKTGQRRFYTSESGEVRYNASGPADAGSPVIQ